MKYPNIKEGIFESRPNRFIAYVTVDGVSEKCHVKNTGRLRELLLPGAECYLCRSDNPAPSKICRSSADKRNSRNLFATADWE